MNDIMAKENEYRITNMTKKGQTVSSFKVRTTGTAADAMQSVLAQYQIPQANTFLVEFMGCHEDAAPGVYAGQLMKVRKTLAGILGREGIDAWVEGP